MTIVYAVCIFLKKIVVFHIYLCMCVFCVCTYAHIHIGACRVQKRASDSLVLKFQTIVNYLLWELKTELTLSIGAFGVFQH